MEKMKAEEWQAMDADKTLDLYNKLVENKELYESLYKHECQEADRLRAKLTALEAIIKL